MTEQKATNAETKTIIIMLLLEGSWKVVESLNSLAPISLYACTLN